MIFLPANSPETSAGQAGASVVSGGIVGNNVRAGFHHSDTVENFPSIRTRGACGAYHHVSEAHLNRCLAEFDFRYSTHLDCDTMRADAMLKGTTGMHLTYRRPREGANA